MDKTINVINFAKILSQNRLNPFPGYHLNLRLYHYRANPWQEIAAYDRWISTFVPKFAFFYTVTGSINSQTKKNITVKLSIMPHLQASGDKMTYPLFITPITVYAQLTDIQKHNADWLSISAEVKDYAIMPNSGHVPKQYTTYQDKILDILAAPIQAPDFEGMRYSPGTKQCFCYFHMLYRPSKKAHMRVGVIDKMWAWNWAPIHLNVPNLPYDAEQPFESPES